jgi:hypothetical protein
VFVHSLDSLKSAAFGAVDIIMGREPRWFHPDYHLDYHLYRTELVDWIKCTALRVPCDSGPSLTARQYMFWYYGLGRIMHESELNNMTLTGLWARYGETLYNIGAAYETIGTIVFEKYYDGIIDTDRCFTREQSTYAAVLRGTHAKRTSDDTRRSLAADRDAPDPGGRARVLDDLFSREFVYDPTINAVVSARADAPAAFAGFGLVRPPVPRVRKFTLVEFVAWNRARICADYPGLGYVGYSQAVIHSTRAGDGRAVDVASACEADAYRLAAANTKAAAVVVAKHAEAVPRAQSDASTDLCRICLDPGDRVPDLVTVVTALVTSGDVPVTISRIQAMCMNWEVFRRDHITTNKRCRHTYFVIEDSPDGIAKNRRVRLSPDITLSDAVRARLLASHTQ